MLLCRRGRLLRGTVDSVIVNEECDEESFGTEEPAIVENNIIINCFIKNRNEVVHAPSP
jgi:hypothetical protein